MTERQLLLPCYALWSVRDGDLDAAAIYRRHYSARRYRHTSGRRLRRIVGPGEYLILVTPDLRSLAIFRRGRLADGRSGVWLTCFRREDHRGRASELIRQVCRLAWQRWPGQAITTWVDPRRVDSAVPGYCFRRAGFRRIRTTRRGLIELTLVPRSTQDG